jgi:hypothetical protein
MSSTSPRVWLAVALIQYASVAIASGSRKPCGNLEAFWSFPPLPSSWLTISHPLPSAQEPIAHVSNGLQVAWTPRIRLDLGAKMRNVAVQ